MSKSKVRKCDGNIQLPFAIDRNGSANLPEQVAEGFRKFLGNYRGRLGTITSYAAMSLIPFTKTAVWKFDYNIAKDMNIYNYEDIFYATQGRMVNWSMMSMMVIITIVLAVGIMWILTREWRPREDYHIVKY